MERKRIEILAPAASLEVGRVALSAGADAIYIGAPRFGARSAASVGLEEIAQLISEAHVYGAKIYVTLNTILTDEELQEAVVLAHQLYVVGADALIIQDMGLLLQELPPIPLHASTQCHNDTPQKIKLLQELGFEQVVVPREMSTTDLARLKGDTTIRIESFVHGALCVSYSGRCFISEACQGRSANRGNCAQYCRMSYDLEDANGHLLIKGQHLLSLRDLNRGEMVEEMLDSGVSSLKIEGRLKGVEYVRNTTAHYRKIVDEIIARRPDEYQRASLGREQINFTPKPEATFSRRFTTYNTPMHRPIPTDEITPFTNKSVGEEVGLLLRSWGKEVEVELSQELANGDGLLFVAQEGNATAGAHVNQVTPIPRRAHHYRLRLSSPIELSEGATIYRNLNHLMTQQLQRPDASIRKVEIDIHCTATPTEVILSSGAVQVSRALQLEPAMKDNTERVEAAIAKLGGTPYTLRQSSVELHGLYLPPSIATEMRRELVERLQEESHHQMVQKRDKTGRALAEARRLFLSQHHDAESYGLPNNLDFTYNVANQGAEQFYRLLGVTGEISPALEVEKPEGEIPVMFTRHCLLHYLGYCTRDKVKPPFALPLYLVRGKERFKLTTNCRDCHMIVWSDPNTH
ncbi:MAG: U32 family peptidase [Porphyromonas sp.]|nr:U32 family peptidase [Porphyromonas sp.]